MTIRRGKRDKDGWKKNEWANNNNNAMMNDSNNSIKPSSSTTTTTTTTYITKTKKRSIQSLSLQKHKNDKPSGGMEVLLPSFIGIAILICGVMAKLGFRGRASVCGIDLGTTNSVICVQEQGGISTSSNYTKNLIIRCIADPVTGSPVVPSVVSFLDNIERQRILSSSSKHSKNTPKIQTNLHPDPSYVVVGQAAKRRIDSHPHHTLYHAKRVLGRPKSDPAITTLRNEVEFDVVDSTIENDIDGVEFHVPDTPIPITPGMVGSYVVHHLLRMTHEVLGHNNVKSAVICVPAKFDSKQRHETVLAFRNAGITVARIVEEPTAAALAYGLHRKPGVDYILVYDFGGGTLDISLLHVSDGFVDVMGSDGDDRLGGSDFDDVIAKFLLQEKGGITIVQEIGTILHQIQESTISPTSDLEDVLSNRCPKLQVTPLCTGSSFHTLGEQLKIELSERYRPDEEILVTAQCLRVGSKHDDAAQWTIETFCSSLEPVTLTLTSSEFSRIAKKLFDRSITPVERLLHDLNILSSDIQEIVMVGGTTRMPQIRQLVQSAFPNSQMNIRIDPDLTVAYGAASVID
jgi:molecular chaperone DnaK (HSP70)